MVHIELVALLIVMSFGAGWFAASTQDSMLDECRAAAESICAIEANPGFRGENPYAAVPAKTDSERLVETQACVAERAFACVAGLAP